MTIKLFLHTALCISLASVLVYHIRDGRRRIALTALLVATVCFCLAPWMYKVFGNTFPRVTIHWAQLFFIGSVLAVFTPGAGKQLSAMSKDFAEPEKTKLKRVA